MTKETCIQCSKETVAVIKTDTGYMCYNCYAEMKNPSKKKKDNEEEREQIEFFKLVPLYFPNLPDKLLFAVPNGGSRNIMKLPILKNKGLGEEYPTLYYLFPKKVFPVFVLSLKQRQDDNLTIKKSFKDKPNIAVVSMLLYEVQNKL